MRLHTFVKMPCTSRRTLSNNSAATGNVVKPRVIVNPCTVNYCVHHLCKKGKWKQNTPSTTHKRDNHVHITIRQTDGYIQITTSPIASSVAEKKYSETWELGTPKGLRKTVLNSEVVLFLRSIST